jgi:hypothetical protein
LPVRKHLPEWSVTLLQWSESFDRVSTRAGSSRRDQRLGCLQTWGLSRLACFVPLLRGLVSRFVRHGLDRQHLHSLKNHPFLLQSLVQLSFGVQE